MGKISGAKVKGWWYNPRTGTAEAAGVFGNSGTRAFECPSLGGFGADVVLVLDDESKGFPPPGVKK
jgi:hypothetical protein